MNEEVAAQIAAAYAALARSDFRAGVEQLQALAARHPETHAAQHACGAVMANLGGAAAAEPYLRRALALSPASADTRVALGLALLAQGNYAEGWPLHEARYDLPGARGKPDLPWPEWRGEPLEGRRLLVWPDEGLGDQIQFLRFVPVLQARGVEVVVCCTLSLARLFAVNTTAFVTPLTLKVDCPEPDLWTMSSFLPGRLGLTPETGPKPPYIRTPEVKQVPGARIGVMARGNPEHVNDRHRSLWPDLAERLTALPGAISLRPEDTGAGDMRETAEIVAGLDLVISVDTSVAHLAGAMGKPVWVLLPAIGLDWRWGLSGETTPWYPSARLFRQPRMNDWPGVVEAVEAALRA